MNMRIKKYLVLFLAFMMTLPLAAQTRVVTPATGESVLVSAVALYDDRNFKEAERLLRALIAECPDNDAALYYMGLCRLMQRDVDSAEMYLRKASEMDPGNYWYRQRLAGLYNMTGRGELAARMYEQLLVDYPKKNEIYYDLVGIYIALKHYDDALVTLDKLEAVMGENESTVMTRFDLLRAQGKHPEAFECLKEYNSRFSSPQVLAVLGDYEMSQYNDSTALSCYNEALEIDPGFAPALLGRAEAYRMSRRYDDYFPEITRFMSIEDIPAAGKSDYLNALVNQTDPKFQRGFRARLDKVFDAAVRTHQADTSLLFVTGLYYVVSERVEKADSCFKAAVNLYPDDVKAAGTYCAFLGFSRDWDRMAATAEIFSEKFPEELAFLDYLSSASYQKGDYLKVIEVSQKLADAADDPKVKLLYAANVGDMYHTLGDAKKAFKVYDKCLKMDPGYAPVLNNYAYYLSLKNKKLKKAYTMSRKTIEAEPDNATYLDTYGWILYLQKKYPEAKGIFKHAMLYGGKESATILDHYAEVLFALGDYDLAFFYWDQALSKAEGDEKVDLKKKIELRKTQKK